ncbi:hypothetical protein [Chondrinema litorale]|uniref:hypothetical protein n=1 Tax=Chondrinema litorale TaxID=2994555 RepID=UPI0025438ECB|nr:hypothetical protein [Chondrinema litorale]UZR93704.1 hypothetical protein OQ292_17800 [Chondrinema litorale]
MNQVITNNWEKLKIMLKHQFSQLTDEDLSSNNEQHLLARLQEKLGVTENQIRSIIYRLHAKSL